MKATTLAIAGLLAAAFPAGGMAQIAVLTSDVDEREALPGETYAGTIRLRNTTAEPQEARIYLTDYRFDATGRTEFGDPGSSERSNARWITVSPSRVSIPPSGEAEVAYTVAVPEADAGLAGTYASMVMVEAVPPGSPESASPAPPPPGLQVRAVIRYGIQIATHIGDTGVREVRFERVHLTALPDGGRVLEFDMVNTGERAIRPAVRLELYDAEGEPAARLDARRGLLYPGCSVRQRFELGPLARRPYKALVVVDAGGDELFGARYTLAP